MEYVVETKNLTKQFGEQKAVSSLNVTIPRGEIYGFLGPNGSGKTTTIRMLLGLMKPTSGTIHVFHKDLKKDRIHILKRIGSLVENPSYYPHLTAYENLEVWRKILGVPKEKIHEVLQIVQLSEVTNKKVKGFSLGMKQRLGIAASLLNDPELLILDEPTNGLDPSGIIEIRNLMKQLASESGMTILISSHLLSEVEQIATRVGIISKGKMLFQDSMDKLRELSKPNIALRISDAKKALRFIVSKGIEADYRDDHIFIPNHSDEDVAELVQQLVYHNFLIYRVEGKKRSLEDIFLQITQEERLV
ncbi:MULTISPECIES: ABC transporter ATP-binding protein [Clostridia]|uniref:ABC transporter ATP-binding protein n=1 Tax=Clostridia TaxID=186801 RepID=UPI000EA3A213|nr:MULTISPECIES: ABC transporter ATP-binding protein [Clostridia]NBJ69200.1 ABC transporter ATP-binding protein [Roseburia sp. 1XD42-34]RKI79172.1 ABC transporter ATP-binding protein [Clostridium sp. 1xD42-85]